jgi:acyl-CoA thioesterase-1
MSDPAIPICFIGDGITLGHGDPQGGGFACRLCDNAAEDGVSLMPILEGGVLWTSREVAYYWEQILYERLGPELIGGLVLCFGARDCDDIASGYRVPVEESLQLALEVIRTAVDRVPLFLIGPPPTGNTVVNPRILIQSRVFRAIAEQCKVPYFAACETMMGSRSWIADMAAGDGIHPRAAGAKSLADAISGSPNWRAWLSLPPLSD